MDRILVLPGDGIGPEVTREACRVLEVVAERHGRKLAFEEGLIGGASIDEGLELAWYHMKEKFVFFGILEKFNESLLMLKRTLGLERTFYEKQNVRDKGSEKTVTPEELEVIREHNQADIQLYDRALQEFDKRFDALGPSMKTELRMFDKVNQRLQRVSELVNQKVGLKQGELINSK